MTFDQAIADLPAELLGAKPDGVPHTPWRIVEHVRIAQWDILEFCRNSDHISPQFPDGYANAARRVATVWPPEEVSTWTREQVDQTNAIPPKLLPFFAAAEYVPKAMHKHNGFEFEFDIDWLKALASSGLLKFVDLETLEGGCGGESEACVRVSKLLNRLGEWLEWEAECGFDATRFRAYCGLAFVDGLFDECDLNSLFGICLDEKFETMSLSTDEVRQAAEDAKTSEVEFHEAIRLAHHEKTGVLVETGKYVSGVRGIRERLWELDVAAGAPDFIRDGNLPDVQKLVLTEYYNGRGWDNTYSRAPGEAWSSDR